MMMNSSRITEYKDAKENIIKDVRNHFRLQKLKKETNDSAIKSIRNFFRLKKKKKVIKGRIIRDIRNFFEHKEEENYYKAVRANNFWSNYYNEHESNGDRKKTLSVKKYPNKIRPYLKDIINNLKNLENPVNNNS